MFRHCINKSKYQIDADHGHDEAIRRHHADFTSRSNLFTGMEPVPKTKPEPDSKDGEPSVDIVPSARP